MRITFKPSALAIVLTSALALAGCSTSSGQTSQEWVPAVEVPPPDPKAEAVAKRRDERQKSEEEGREIAREIRNLGVDDYRHESGMTAFSSEPGWKSRRQLEIEKIHRLAKMCIAANNVSPPCLDIVNVNARMGKFYILQESQSFSAALKRMTR